MMKRVMLLGLLMLVGLGLGLAATTSTVQAQIFKGSNWDGRYFDNTTFGSIPAFNRTDAAVEFIFGAGPVTGPSGQQIGVGGAGYSIRWTTQVNFTPGNYTFSLSREDDARVLLNGVTIIDFNNSDLTSPQFVSTTISVPGGLNTLDVFFIKRSGNGSIQFQWQLAGGGGQPGTALPTAVPTRTPLPPIPPGALTATVIRASVLNTRDAPSLGGNVLGRILRGERYAVIGRDADARWFLLQLGGYQAWAWGYYLFIDGNEFNAPVSSPFGTIGVPGGVQDTGIVVQAFSTLRLRQAPSVASAQIGRVTWGAFLPVTGRTADGYWYQVVWKGTVGWVYSPYVKPFQGDPAAAPVK